MSVLNFEFEDDAPAAVAVVDESIRLDVDLDLLVAVVE